MMARGRGGHRDAGAARGERPAPLPHHHALSPVAALRWPGLAGYGGDVRYELAPGRTLSVEQADDGHDCPAPDAPAVAGLGVPADVDAGTNSVHFVLDGACWTVRLDDRTPGGAGVDEVVALTRALLPG